MTEQECNKYLNEIPLQLLINKVNSIFSDSELAERHIFPIAHKIMQKYEGCKIKSSYSEYQYKIWLKGKTKIIGEGCTYGSALTDLARKLGVDLGEF